MQVADDKAITVAVLEKLAGNPEEEEEEAGDDAADTAQRIATLQVCVLLRIKNVTKYGNRAAGEAGGAGEEQGHGPGGRRGGVILLVSFVV